MDNKTPAEPDLFSGDGVMRALMRASDWAASPLGDPDKWPQALRTVVRLMLDSKFPMFVAWGHELAFLYNDAYAEILGAKHPQALGCGFQDVWSEIWPDISPLIHRALAGEATYSENLPLVMLRKGHEEQTWFTFSYSPVRDDRGTIAGMYCACTETTGQVLSERRHAFQLEMTDRMRGLSDPYEIMAVASELLSRNLKVNRAVFGEIDDQVESIRFHSSYTDGTVPELAGIHRLNDFGTANIADLLTGHTVVYNDVTLDLRTPDSIFLKNIASIEVRASIGVPIVRLGKLRAVLGLHQRKPRRWTNEEVKIVEDVAERTWHAVERARAEAVSKASISALRQLNQVAQSVHAELRRQPLMQVVTDAALHVSGAQFGAFFHNLVDENGESYTLYTISGAPREAFSKFPTPRNTAVFGSTFEGLGPKRCDDITKDPEYGKNLPYAGMPEGHLPVRSYLAVPVRSRSGEVFGGLFLGHGEPGRFTEEHERLVQGIATQAAIGIINSRFYESQQTLLEAERHARTAAERESRLKEEFLNTLSHELRTPLNAIVGWAALLRLRRKDDPELEKGLTVIERNAHAQAKIIDDLLDMSRITSGNVQLEFQEVDLAQAIREALESVRPTADAKRVRIQATLAGDAGPVRWDPIRLQQVLWNLLTNAVKFTPEDGLVEIRLVRVANHIEMSVIDSGRGIEPDFLPFIFDRFRQADGSAAREYGGLGLGLAIVKSLVDMHRSRVYARSGGKGQGSTFVLQFAAVDGKTLDSSLPGRAANMAVPVCSEPLPDITGLKVLVVDDEPDSLALMQTILGNAGAVVTPALSVRSALQKMAEERPDVLLSDLGMPTEDGYMLIRAVREREKSKGFAAIPAAAVTAFARAEDAQQALNAGFDCHLPKPVSPPVVIAMVGKLAGR
jgi:signal transduction histidine kinase